MLDIKERVKREVERINKIIDGQIDFGKLKNIKQDYTINKFCRISNDGKIQQEMPDVNKAKQPSQQKGKM